MHKGQFTRLPERLRVHVIGPSIMYLPLSQGMFTCIEIEDYEVARAFRWHADKHHMPGKFYARDRTGLRLHRVLCGFPPSVDHRNGNTLDNRRLGNLRPCSSEQNSHNAAVKRTSRTGLKGVSFNTKNRNLPSLRPWRAEILFYGNRINLGQYATPELAHAAYIAKSRELHGEFFRA